MSTAAARTASAGGTVPGRRVRAYDFSQPDNLDRNQLRSLRIPLDNFARRAGRILSGRLRVPVRFEEGELDHRTWSDLSEEIEDPTSLSIFSLNPLPGRSVLHVPLGLAMKFVDLALGGMGKGPYPERPLTEVEQAVVSGMLKVVLDELAAAFSSGGPLTASIVSEASSPVLVQLPTVQNTHLVCPFSVTVGEGESLPLRLILPLLSLRPLLPSLAGEDEEPSSTDGPAQLILERLAEVPIEASVRFPPVGLTSVEITGLRPGDVVPLGIEADSPLVLAVQDLEWSLVVPGRKGKRIICSVTRVLQEA